MPTKGLSEEEIAQTVRFAHGRAGGKPLRPALFDAHATQMEADLQARGAGGTHAAKSPASRGRPMTPPKQTLRLVRARDKKPEPRRPRCDWRRDRMPYRATPPRDDWRRPINQPTPTASRRRTVYRSACPDSLFVTTDPRSWVAAMVPRPRGHALRRYLIVRVVGVWLQPRLCGDVVSAMSNWTHGSVRSRHGRSRTLPPVGRRHVYSARRGLPRR